MRISVSSFPGPPEELEDELLELEDELLLELEELLELDDELLLELEELLELEDELLLEVELDDEEPGSIWEPWTLYAVNGGSSPHASREKLYATVSAPVVFWASPIRLI